MQPLWDLLVPTLMDVAFNDNGGDLLAGAGGTGQGALFSSSAGGHWSKQPVSRREVCACCYRDGASPPTTRQIRPRF